LRKRKIASEENYLTMKKCSSKSTIPAMAPIAGQVDSPLEAVQAKKKLILLDLKSHNKLKISNKKMTMKNLKSKKSNVHICSISKT